MNAIITSKQCADLARMVREMNPRAEGVSTALFAGLPTGMFEVDEVHPTGSHRGTVADAEGLAKGFAGMLSPYCKDRRYYVRRGGHTFATYRADGFTVEKTYDCYALPSRDDCGVTAVWGPERPNVVVVGAVGSAEKIYVVRPWEGGKYEVLTPQVLGRFGVRVVYTASGREAGIGMCKDHYRKTYMPPKPGMGVTILGWSDASAGTVIKATAKTMVVQMDRVTLLNPPGSGEPDEMRVSPGGFAGHWSGTMRYHYTRNHEGRMVKATKRKDGTWRPVGQTTKPVTLGVRAHHRDNNF